MAAGWVALVGGIRSRFHPPSEQQKQHCCERINRNVYESNMNSYHTYVRDERSNGARTPREANAGPGRRNEYWSFMESEKIMCAERK